jgi:hypothetical protein
MFCLSKKFPCGFQKTHQQLKFPGDLGENIGRYVCPTLSISGLDVGGVVQSP